MAGQHFLASPPDIHSGRQRGHPLGDEDSDVTTQYSEGLADNELDSEISSLFGAGDGRDARLQNLHLMSPLEYAAMLKQYTEYSEPVGVLGQDITPDSGVVVDSRHHSKASPYPHFLKMRLFQFCNRSVTMQATKENISRNLVEPPRAQQSSLETLSHRSRVTPEVVSGHAIANRK